MSGILLFVLVALASADALCAWPCARVERTAAREAAGGPPSHDCHSAPAGGAAVTAPGQQTCAMAHGASGPVAHAPERAAPVAVLATELRTNPDVTVPSGYEPRPVTPAGRPPGRHLPLRI